jgi:RNA polymerase sigma factor (TIGR02999 family)
MADRPPITILLQRWSGGDEAALDELAPLVNAKLKSLAQSAFRNEHDVHTLQPTAVVNEAWLQLVDSSVDWKSRGHFYALVARMMRRILVNHARTRQAAKRGGGQVKLTFDDERMSDGTANPDILDLEDAIAALGKVDERMVQLLELHYFAGLGFAEAAEAMGVSTSTAKRDISFAKAWIRQHMNSGNETGGTENI